MNLPFRSNSWRSRNRKGSTAREREGSRVSQRRRARGTRGRKDPATSVASRMKIGVTLLEMHGGDRKIAITIDTTRADE